MVLPNINKWVVTQEEAVQKALSVSQNRGNPMTKSIPGANDSEDFDDMEEAKEVEHSLVKEPTNMMPR